MKSVDVEIGGQKWAMPVCYAASREIAEAVDDPLSMAYKAAGGSLDMTTTTVVDILAIGLKHAGCGWTTDQIGEHVIDGGVINYAQTVGEYISALVSGGPSKPTKSSGASKKKPVAGSKS